MPLNNPPETDIPPAVAGDVLEFLMSLNTERQTASLAYVKVKEAVVPRSGTYRVKFDLKCFDATAIAYGRIYKGGVAHGTEQTQADATWTTKSEDLVFDALDTVELWYKTNNINKDAFVRNFKLYIGNPLNLQNVTD